MDLWRSLLLVLVLSDKDNADVGSDCDGDLNVKYYHNGLLWHNVCEEIAVQILVRALSVAYYLDR